ncbi:nitroreductase [Candidatus Pseudothioglobus singularis]|jgi:nitroreductase|uniref:p-nitrobenzoate reductase NfnB n=1 Tax=Candidatus Pseudothioglobus singularis PS1 TaxID=1125411 RepID=A0A0M4M267_9GAMM|nr:nitroreductase [Candidatus Pseudothioglobus singularis]ALE01654.1 P-nitrobenzoate reductase NfnB [Candidatus Pseudothioglobus singularis PS1]
MDLKTTLMERKSTRAFLDKEVSMDTINEIIEQSKTAPSGVNTQPWQVAVIKGESKNNLCNKFEKAFRGGVKGAMDYKYYPVEWLDEYKQRRKECGLMLYSTLNISREDKERQLDQWALNYQAFNAPVILLFFIDRSMEKGSFMDYGMFIQSIMLSAVEKGLATCPQAALGEYPDIVRQEFPEYKDKMVLCGLALGYEDKDQIVNSYRTPREDIGCFVRYYN